MLTVDDVSLTSDRDWIGEQVAPETLLHHPLIPLYPTDVDLPIHFRVGKDSRLRSVGSEAERTVVSARVEDSPLRLLGPGDPLELHDTVVPTEHLEAVLSSWLAGVVVPPVLHELFLPLAERPLVRSEVLLVRRDLSRIANLDDALDHPIPQLAGLDD